MTRECNNGDQTLKVCLYTFSRQAGIIYYLYCSAQHLVTFNGAVVILFFFFFFLVFIVSLAPRGTTIRRFTDTRNRSVFLQSVLPFLAVKVVYITSCIQF